MAAATRKQLTARQSADAVNITVSQK